MKSVMIALAALPLVFISGCSEISGLMPSSSPAGPVTVTSVELAAKWKVSQLRIEVTGDRELPVLLKLAAGDRVDGYFHLETGRDIDFSITGSSLMYQSAAPDDTGRVVSDRFSFTATQAQGSTYTLSFSNAEKDEEAKSTVFLEVIYPVSGSIFTPLEAR